MITYTQLGRHGNTGNSMFQFAALVGASKTTKFKFGVPKHPSYYEVNYGCNNRSIFDGFEINCPIITEEDKPKFIHQYKEPHFHFNSDIERIKDWTDLSGFYQTEKYFKHCKEEVFNYFTFKHHIRDNINNKIKQGVYPDPKFCTSIHIRRGDFVYKQQFHPLQDSQYYKSACKLTNTKKYVFFSDDIEWCKKTFGEHDRLAYSMETDPFEAMYHMSLCSNHIISNSSFGWWGAWLGEMASSNKESIIVAPTKWFGPAYPTHDTKDVVPGRWLKI
tara:strand:+ start:515 stop:1339 length:825 start_codon:yes stop_codon:yes gene_type:complete